MSSVWVFAICALGASLGFGVLLHKNPDISVAAQVITLASSLVTGAFGAAAGHAVGIAKGTRTTTVPGDPGVKIEEKQS